MLIDEGVFYALDVVHSLSERNEDVVLCLDVNLGKISFVSNFEGIKDMF